MVVGEGLQRSRKMEIEEERKDWSASPFLLTLSYTAPLPLIRQGGSQLREGPSTDDIHTGGVGGKADKRRDVLGITSHSLWDKECADVEYG